MNGNAFSAQRRPPVYVVSGGAGASGEHLARTALAQFSDVVVPVQVVSHIRDAHNLENVVIEAAAHGGLILHTLVDATLRERMAEMAARHHVVAVDAMRPLMEALSQMLDRPPLERPGLYRELNERYFRRVDAIEFTVAHDDGKRVEELGQADIVLTGVSRVGKTPVSIFLSMQGWKVANVPFVLEVPPPKELLEMDPRRVAGLVLKPQQLLLHRRTRLLHLGVEAGAYVALPAIVEEMRAAQHYFARQGFRVVDMTDKPIEAGAEEVLKVASLASEHSG